MQSDLENGYQADDCFSGTCGRCKHCVEKADMPKPTSHVTLTSTEIGGYGDGPVAVSERLHVWGTGHDLTNVHPDAACFNVYPVEPLTRSDPESQLQTAFNTRAYVVGPPWGDGTWLVLDEPDPHIGTRLADCSLIDDEDDPTSPQAYTSIEAAAEIAKRWNDAAELREFLYVWGEATRDVGEAGCSEQDTGACASFNPSLEWCDGCKNACDAWDRLKGIEKVMLEAYEQLREAGYER